jgi:hypothetical protein
MRSATRAGICVPRRTGFTLLETQVAFVLLGIALAGVCPLVVMQSKLSRKIAGGFDPQTSYFGVAKTYTLVPAADPWTRKLGVAASIVQGAGAPLATGGHASPGYVVTIVAPIHLPSDDGPVTVHVKATKAASP